MIYAFTNTTQTLEANEAIKYNNVGVRAGKTTSLAAGSGTFTLNVPGYYLINFNADVAADAGLTNVQLFREGTAVEGASASAFSTALTDVQNLSFSALIYVRNNCCNRCCADTPVTLTFINTGVVASVFNTAVTITKVA